MKTTKTLTGRISRMTAMTIIALSLNLTAFAGTAIEEQISVESWMTAPFELNVFEQEVAVESWMTAPF
ncbi:MAG: hypothetical protein JXN62_11090, partial [Bacteroidales bacterium]|nr:hypothetical protein [Bacteroidales bacterium]